MYKRLGVSNIRCTMACLSDEQLEKVKNYCYAALKEDLDQRLSNKLDTNNDTNITFDRNGSAFQRNGSLFERGSSFLKNENVAKISAKNFDSSKRNEKDPIKQLSKIRRRYQDGFTMHSLDHIINGTWIERVFWIFKLSLAIIVAVYLSWQLLQGFLNHHVDSKVSIETKTKIQLPMLFICGTKAKHYLSAFHDCRSNDSRSYDEEICEELNHTCPHFCWNSHDLHLGEDGTVLCNKELLGQCITVNANGKLFQTPTRPAGVYTQEVHSNHLPLWVYIKTPGSVDLIPRSWFQFSRIKVHGDYHFILEKTSIKRLPYPFSDPSCIIEGSEEAFSKNIFIGNYTLDKCLTTCYTRAQLTACGTTHVTYRAQLRNPHSFKEIFEDKNISQIEQCMVENYVEMADIYESCRMTCSIPCVEDSYRVSVRYEPHNNSSSKKVNIYFYYQEMKETRVEHHPSLSISTLVALSLFLF